MRGSLEVSILFNSFSFQDGHFLHHGGCKTNYPFLIIKIDLLIQPNLYLFTVSETEHYILQYNLFIFVKTITYTNEIRVLSVMYMV